MMPSPSRHCITHHSLTSLCRCFRIPGPHPTLKDPVGMKDYTAEFIRNVALVSHSGAGQTALVEALLFQTGAVNRMGKVEEGNTVSDFEEEEIRRQQSLSTSLLPLAFNDRQLNLLDPPRFTAFVGEAISALHVAEGAIVLADAVAGVEVGTELLWGYCDQFELP